MSSKEEPHTTMIIFVSPPVGVVSEEKIRRGAKLLSTTIKRNHPESLDPRIKSVNYQANVLMKTAKLSKAVLTKQFLMGLMVTSRKGQETISG